MTVIGTRVRTYDRRLWANSWKVRRTRTDDGRYWTRSWLRSRIRSKIWSYHWNIYLSQFFVLCLKNCYPLSKLNNKSSHLRKTPMSSNTLSSYDYITILTLESNHVTLVLPMYLK